MTRYAQYPLVTVLCRLHFIAVAFEKEVEKLALQEELLPYLTQEGQPLFYLQTCSGSCLGLLRDGWNLAPGNVLCHCSRAR